MPSILLLNYWPLNIPRSELLITINIIGPTVALLCLDFTLSIIRLHPIYTGLASVAMIEAYSEKLKRTYIGFLLGEKMKVMVSLLVHAPDGLLLNIVQ